MRHGLEIYISIGCMGLGGIGWFLAIDKDFPELGKSVAIRVRR
jgi:hypothetical protein